MQSHRIRLTDLDIEVIVSALRARAAMLSGERAHHSARLKERLAECTPGNPQMILGRASQRHETPEMERATRRELHEARLCQELDHDH